MTASSGLAAPKPEISPAELEREISSRLARVPEFEFIRAEAAKLGVKVYLFGGTSAGFAHYVKWDLQREKGDPRFQPDRFDYDFTNIYRSTQDLDLVVDGPTERAALLGGLLRKKFPNFQGSKDQWELRLLRETSGDKEALLNNPDFSNQHTDSNSTGLIEITTSNDPVVRDLRDWSARTPQFLRDVAEGKLHFYFSDKHSETSRFQKGFNPPILSVVRAYTKAFQYELEIRPEDVAVLQKIIRSFDPKTTRPGSYVASWLEKNATKLVRHAVNVEYAWNTIEKNGLRKKMIEVSGGTTREDSMGWWLNREPLRTYEVGAGKGKTARELKLDLVAHETQNFLAYESITRSHTGEPNALTSRSNAPGEAAVHGEGFYTRVGRKGARNTGWTIRFHLHPEARLGTDFLMSGEYIVVRNKRALRVIHEDLKFSLVDYFALAGRLDFSDKGILEKAKRRFANKWQTVTKAEVEEIKAWATQQIKTGKTTDAIINDWMGLPFALENPEVTVELLRGTQVGFAATYAGRLPLAYQIKLVEETLAKGPQASVDWILDLIANQPRLLAHARMTTWLREILRKFPPERSIGEMAIRSFYQKPPLGDVFLEESIAYLRDEKANVTSFTLGLLQKLHQLELLKGQVTSIRARLSEKLERTALAHEDVREADRTLSLMQNNGFKMNEEFVEKVLSKWIPRGGIDIFETLGRAEALSGPRTASVVIGLLGETLRKDPVAAFTIIKDAGKYIAKVLRSAPPGTLDTREVTAALTSTYWEETPAIAARAQLTNLDRMRAVLRQSFTATNYRAANTWLDGRPENAEFAKLMSDRATLSILWNDVREARKLPGTKPYLGPAVLALAATSLSLDASTRAEMIATLKETAMETGARNWTIAALESFDSLDRSAALAKLLFESDPTPNFRRFGAYKQLWSLHREFERRHSSKPLDGVTLADSLQRGLRKYKVELSSSLDFLDADLMKGGFDRGLHAVAMTLYSDPNTRGATARGLRYIFANDISTKDPGAVKDYFSRFDLTNGKAKPDAAVRAAMPAFIDLPMLVDFENANSRTREDFETLRKLLVQWAAYTANQVRFERRGEDRQSLTSDLRLHEGTSFAVQILKELATQRELEDLLSKVPTKGNGFVHMPLFFSALRSGSLEAKGEMALPTMDYPMQWIFKAMMAARDGKRYRVPEPRYWGYEPADYVKVAKNFMLATDPTIAALASSLRRLRAELSTAEVVEPAAREPIRSTRPVPRTCPAIFR